MKFLWEVLGGYATKPKPKTVKKYEVSQYEGKSCLLFEDKGNPYESIYIEGGIIKGELTLLDKECDHDPDGGGWSCRMVQFDAENTNKVFTFLCEKGEPIEALKRMLNSRDRLGIFLAECGKREIKFTDQLKI